MTDARLSAATVEALVDGTPARRISVAAVEALTDGTPVRRVVEILVEVLTPAQLTATPTNQAAFLQFF